MNRKKILILNPYVFSKGGGEKHMCCFCKFLEEYYEGEVEIDILTYGYKDIDIWKEDYVTIEELNRQFDLDLKCTRLYKVTFQTSNPHIRYLEEDIKIRRISRKYDIFVNWMFLSKQIGKAKVNLYACMFPPKKYPKTSIRHLGKGYRFWVDRQFEHHYDAYICNSDYTRKWLCKVWNVKGKDEMIYPPVFSGAFQEERYQEWKKENIILSVGRFFVAGHNKKQLELVRFFINHQEELKGYQYHLVGNVAEDSADRGYLEEIKREARKTERIYIHENCGRGELDSLYERAKIFWHGTGYQVEEEREPEKLEHFGISTVEAMAYGVVPVVINKGGQKEMIEQGVTGYLWNTEEECIERTKRLIQAEKMRKEMAKRAAKESDKYSMEMFFKRNQNLFEGLQKRKVLRRSKWRR